MPPLTALEFLSQFTRELLKADPMERQNVVIKWAEQLEECYTPFPDQKR